MWYACIVLVCLRRPNSPRLKRVTIVVEINMSPKRFNRTCMCTGFRCHTCISSSSIRLPADNHHQFVLTSKDNAHTIMILITKCFNHSLSLYWQLKRHVVENRICFRLVSIPRSSAFRIAPGPCIVSISLLVLKVMPSWGGIRSPLGMFTGMFRTV